jgi:hypothetical protein
MQTSAFSKQFGDVPAKGLTMQLILTRAQTIKPFDYDLKFVAIELANRSRFDCGRHQPHGVPAYKDYSIAQHVVAVSLYQELIGAAVSVQMWGLHHEDQYAYATQEDPKGLDYHQRLTAEAIPLKPVWPPPASLQLHNLIVTATEALVFGLALDPEVFKGVEPDERMTYAIKPLDPTRSRVLYLERHSELCKALERENK